LAEKDLTQVNFYCLQEGDSRVRSVRGAASAQ
jgi:hypothetical protein